MGEADAWEPFEDMMIESEVLWYARRALVVIFGQGRLGQVGLVPDFVQDG